MQHVGALARRRARTRAAPRARSRDPSGSRGGRRTPAPTRRPRGTARRTPTRTWRRSERSGSARAGVVERGADRGDAAVHHVARADDVRAGLGVADGRAREQLERRVVVDLAVVERRRSGRATVYSQRQTSVSSDELREARAAARAARCWTTPSSSQAPEPSSSFSSGIPKRMTAPTPRPQRARPPRATSVVDREAAERRQPARSRTASGPTKSGKTKSSRSSRVSRTSARSAVGAAQAAQARAGEGLTANNLRAPIPGENAEDGAEPDEPERLAARPAARGSGRRARR